MDKKQAEQISISIIDKAKRVPDQDVYTAVKDGITEALLEASEMQEMPSHKDAINYINVSGRIPRTEWDDGFLEGCKWMRSLTRVKGNK